MDPPLLLLLLPALLLLAVANALPPSCRNVTCGGHVVQYPFSLNSSASECGYPGLDLVCEDNTTLILPIKSHRYKVVGINYDTHTIAVSDADIDDGEHAAGCPRLHANLSIDTASSWLQLTQSDSNITFFYNCKKNISLSSAVELVGCQEQDGELRTYVLPDGGITGAEAYEYECDEVVVALVLEEHKRALVDAPPSVNNGSFDRLVRGGFELIYGRNSSQCGTCERSGGWCGYLRNETHGGVEFTCFCDDGPATERCGNARRTIIEIVAITSCLLFLCLVVLAFFWTCKYGWIPFKSNNEPRIESFLQKNRNLHPKRYTYAEVKRMTKSFAVKLGQGGFGAVYRGSLSDGRQVAVKLLKATKGDGEEFMNEVASISRTSHVNVVTLLGFCLQGSKRALIYEYMANGSLERYAFSSNMSSEDTLGWEKLFSIAIGIARGLEYLHRGCNTRIVHFDIKPHNILLDQDFCPKISDFGLAKLCLNKESAISIGGARGTIGYIAPEVYSKQFGTVSSKSDVYSYGMMVLEMVGARDKNINTDSEGSSQYFPQWIYEHLDDYCISASEINGEITELVRKMIVVSLWCIQVIPTDRPTMTRVVEMLEGSTKPRPCCFARAMPLLPCLLLFLGVHGSTSHGSPAPLPPTCDASICSETFKCGGVDVRYPFYLSNATRETTEHTSNYSCGYTDLEISCQHEGWTSTPVIRLGSGGDNYTVQNIFYDDDDGHSGTIVLADSDVMIGGNTCPTVHHNVSFSEVWLNNTSSNDNLTFFFGCDSVPRLGVYRIDHYNGFKSPVAGVDSYSYVFTPKDRDQVQELQSAGHCKEMVSVPVSEYLKMAVTVNNWTMFRTGGYGDVLEHGFELRWSRTTRDQCYPCEQSSGRCSYSQQSRGFLGCLCSYGKAHNSDCNASNVVASTSSLVFLCLLILAFFWTCKYGWIQFKSKNEPRIESFLQRNGNLHPKRYTYADVKRMTQYFAMKLGQGGFGAVYRGNLSDGRQLRYFMNEVASISRTSHVNIVTLLGFCLQGSKRALIYEFMPNGSLETYAFSSNMNNENTLSWEKLFYIAIGSARGLEHLHRGCNTRIVHFDIKPHNILLDQEFCPKISDFGLAKLCLNKESSISIGGARGTIGYIAPEVYSKQYGTVSSKSDVYSYGMMVLEMAGIYEHFDDYCISASGINGEITELVRKMIVTTPEARYLLTRFSQSLHLRDMTMGAPPHYQIAMPASGYTAATPHPQTKPSSRPVALLIHGFGPAGNRCSAAPSGSSPCSAAATCGDINNITYPFHLLSDDGAASSAFCGYPALGLDCVDGNTTVLRLSTNNNTVTSINYPARTMSVVDSGIDSAGYDCPSIAHNVTVAPGSGVQFTTSDASLTFLVGCAGGDALPPACLNGSSPIGCGLNGVAGDGEMSYVYRGANATAAALPGGSECASSCRGTVIMTVYAALFDVPSLSNLSANYARVLKNGFELSWDTSFDVRCGPCESSGGWCGYNRTSTASGGGGALAFSCICPDGRTRPNVIVSTMGAVLMIFLAYLLYCKRTYGSFVFWRKRVYISPRVNAFLQRHGSLHPKVYSYMEVKRMTKSFVHQLGQGGCGVVYKGRLPDGRLVAVKMLKELKGDDEQFMNEVASISTTSHVNIVTLLGFCVQGSKRALVYDYMPNGSLERFIFRDHLEDRNPLSWGKLFEIAVGIARGLEYLHRGCNTRIVHFDIKPHNILLDENFCPKISDFGLAKLSVQRESTISIGVARGTIGYIAPELFSRQFGVISSKSDVYSYGMMILEMVGSIRNPNNSNGESSDEFYFPLWIYENLDQYCLDASKMAMGDGKLVRKMIIVGLWCVQVMPTDRPSMSQVLEMLESELEDLQLPSKPIHNLEENGPKFGITCTI
ncbi:LOW QUALITY PROTEIN: hypothetical protein U9M48_018042 [Paspalum notatum var. saurae]|uniref:non-specific serine/threonine protein kinase n=1 Tax=Paspalum notatum var. saurae TaxID=547442 RepID=A0AAQ3WPF0_PASNO